MPSHGSSRIAACPIPITVGLSLCLSLPTCGGGDDAGQEGREGRGAGEAAPSAFVVEGVGFSTPESVLHDPGADVYLVSNISGSPLGKDGDGFISRLSPEGEVLDLRWIEGGAKGVELHAPKGMAVSQGLLYVADIDCIRVFDLESGAPVEAICVPGATFLNDVAAGPEGVLYFTDSGLRMGDEGFVPSGTDAVYRMENGMAQVVAAGEELGRANGVAVGPGGLFVVTFGSSEVMRIDEGGERTILRTVPDGQLDGIVILEDGSYLVSSWGQRAVLGFGGAEGGAIVADEVEAPADIGYDATRRRVLIPLFNGDAVLVKELR